jgi:hypothetical protein
VKPLQARGCQGVSDLRISLHHEFSVDYVTHLYYMICILGLGGASPETILRTTPGAKRAAGTNNTALFDIVNAATGNGSLRAPRLRTLGSRASPRVRAVRGPRVNSAETRELGATRLTAAGNNIRLTLQHEVARARVVPGARSPDGPFLVKRTHVAQTQHVGTRGANGSYTAVANAGVRVRTPRAGRTGVAGCRPSACGAIHRSAPSRR